jgi:hypothetical protein
VSESEDLILMETFIATLILFGAVMAAMAVGVVVSGRRLRGSCGGTGKDCACDDEARRSCALKARESNAR